MDETIEMTYSTVLFYDSAVFLSTLMPDTMRQALAALLVVNIETRMYDHQYVSPPLPDIWPEAMRLLHLPDGRIGMLMVGGEIPIDARVFSDFLYATEGFWAARDYHFPCYHAETLAGPAEFIGHISVQEACNGD